jgi:autotransporter family porin
MPIEHKVHESLAARPRQYDPRWDSWLLARVTGHHVGTTDEIIQWAACKWGISDNLLRAVAVRLSQWYQYEVYPNGDCVVAYGCGDQVARPDLATRVYCAGLSQAGHDYERDFGAGRCPKTFSIVGVMSWQAPAWGPAPGRQNGTFPFNRDSTAFALDYVASYLRGCDEGWVHWLNKKHVGDTYAPGDIWGCVGSLYAGAWHTKPAVGFIADVRDQLRHRTWLDPAFAEFKPPCSPRFGGCPHGISKAYGGGTTRR